MVSSVDFLYTWSFVSAVKMQSSPVTFLLVSGISAVISFTIDALITSPDHFPTTMQALLPIIHNTVSARTYF